MYRRVVQQTTCLSCRLHTTIAQLRLARQRRGFTLTSPAPYPRKARGPSAFSQQPPAYDETSIRDAVSPEEIVFHARKTYGDKLPTGLLNEEEMKIYERKYGKPQPVEQSDLSERRRKNDTSLLRETDEGLEEVSDGKRDKKNKADVVLEQDIQASISGQRLAESEGLLDERDDRRFDEENPAETDHTRVHPLTLSLRFSTNPSTIHLPKDTFVDPSTVMLAEASGAQLSDMAHRTFGGVGLPYSESTPRRLKTMQQKPIALDAAQPGMSPMEGNVFLAALMPGVYASVLGVLTEMRKRLGTAWAEGLVRKAEAGELRILDAGGAGVGVLAVRDILRAEWERMHELGDSPTALAPADGRVGGVGASPPLGTATVLTGSDTLRKRASQLLDNTTFIPRLPDYIHTETAQSKGKFDIVIAPHTLWPLREDHLRKVHTQNLWSLLSSQGGVLLLLEKGVPRGFELVAAAREMLLHSRISSPGHETSATRLDDPEVDWEEQDDVPNSQPKETGMIIAPCTNHSACPVYRPRGRVKARKDICYFEQRYIRPAYLQHILGARDKNWEDVNVSYLSVMRGQDLRHSDTEHAPLTGIQQDESTTQKSFGGYGATPYDNHDISWPHALNFPRILSPPLKKRGHVTFDVCTPAATYERWTVPKSFGKQAYRDARKSSWGDLWAMGAKTRTPRETRVGKHGRQNREEQPDGSLEQKPSRKYDGIDTDDDGRLVYGRAAEALEGGKMRTGKKVKGIRDKRDKKGTGNGRRKIVD